MKVLIADDDVDNRRLLQLMLSAWGHEVVVTCDGQEAWQTLQREDTPQLLILDWMMPFMDGVQVCRKVRETPHAKLFYIILLTAKDLREDLITGLSAGADDYITKPFDKQELHARIQVGVRVLELQDRLAEEARKLEAERQRTRHYRDLATARARFDAAVSAMSDGIVVTDGNYSITTVNRSARLLLNLPPSGWERFSLGDVLESFTLSTSFPELQSSSERVSALEIARLNTSPPLFLDGRLTRLDKPDSGLESTVLTVRDITAERHEQHVRANFFEMVSHKLRTPLSILSGYLALCRQLPPEQMVGQLSYVLDVCGSHTRRLEEIIGKLLEFKRLSTEQLEAEAEPTEVSPIIAALEEEVRKQHPSVAIEIATMMPQSGLCVGVSADHVHFVLSKLLDNAVKFADKNPVKISIKVEGSSRSTARPPGGESREDEGQLVISVSDNGPGIPHEYYDRIFHGFMQVEDRLTGQVPGLGVGLSMARQVVQSYGGEITLESRLGEGSTFSFTLPLG